MNNAPIGIFDSGVGGLTVARAIIDQLPNESIIYVGDTANTPYGPKPLSVVRELALDVMDRLVDEGVKLLVIACNSASAAASISGPLVIPRSTKSTKLGQAALVICRSTAAAKASS